MNMHGKNHWHAQALHFYIYYSLVFECISCHISDGPIHSNSTSTYFHAFNAPKRFTAHTGCMLTMLHELTSQ